MQTLRQRTTLQAWAAHNASAHEIERRRCRRDRLENIAAALIIAALLVGFGVI